jgi:hypothetical protein
MMIKEEFYELLEKYTKECNTNWEYMTAKETDSIYTDDLICPIVFVYNKQANDTLCWNEVYKAGRRLGLSNSDIDLIRIAADLPLGLRDESVRQALLKATGAVNVKRLFG